MAITSYVVVPFGHIEGGGLMPLEPAEAPNAEVVRRRAQAAEHGGALAFSRTGDPHTGEFSDTEILVTYGEVDRGCWGSSGPSRSLGPPQVQSRALMFIRAFTLSGT